MNPLVVIMCVFIIVTSVISMLYIIKLYKSNNNTKEEEKEEKGNSNTNEKKQLAETTGYKETESNKSKDERYDHEELRQTEELTLKKTEEIVPRTWFQFQKLTTKYSSSSSFGYTFYIYNNNLLIGCPFDDKFGRLKIYNFDEREITLNTDYLFKSGTENQKAGFAISGNFISAPDYSFSLSANTITCGTIFHVCDWNTNEKIIRVKQINVINHSDSFEMVKTGKCIYYNKPYLFVVKTKDKHFRVDVFIWNDELRKVELLQKIEEKSKESTLGHDIVCNKNNTLMFMTNPVKNMIFIFEMNKNNKKWDIWKTVKVQLDEHSKIFLNGNHVIISQPSLQKVDIRVWNNVTKTLDTSQLLTTIIDQNFANSFEYERFVKENGNETKGYDLLFAQSIAIVKNWLVISGEHKFYVFYQKNGMYRLLEEIVMDRFMKTSNKSTFKTTPIIRHHMVLFLTENLLTLVLSTENTPRNRNCILFLARTLH